MTLRDVFENCLIELNKVQAPSLLVKDFVYLYNKAVQMVFNKRYNLFEINQQLTDDLRVLTKTVKIIPTSNTSGATFNDSWDCELPDDYVHILNCICEFEDLNPSKTCSADSSVFQQGASKLDTNQWPSVITNHYMRPSAKRPYYYIINIDDPNRTQQLVSSSLKDLNVLEPADPNSIRYGNSVKPIMQIKCGNDRMRYDLRCVYVDYLRAPKYLALDQDILDEHTDKSQVLEFPDYMCYEIIHEIVSLALENGKDPRLQTFTPITQSIPQK